MIDIYACDERITTTTAATRKITTNIRYFGRSISRKYIDRMGRNELSNLILEDPRRTKMSYN